MYTIPAQPVLVTGGGGFLGKAVCMQLLARGYRVRSFSRGTYLDLEAAGIECRQGSLQDPHAIAAALEGCGGVFHCAGNVNVWGRWADLYATNVTGTENVLAGMRAHSIRSLVFTSSPSVVCTSHSLEGVDESQPYPAHYLSAYPATKALAEQKVMAANGQGVQHTVSIRPHFIWGPGDPHLLPNLIQARKKNLLRPIGNRKNLVDAIYVENAALAHVQAFEALEQDPARLGGKVYFVGQEAPLNLWAFIDQMLKSVGAAPLGTGHSIPFPLAYGFGYLCEKVYGLLRIHDRLPPMTRFIALQMAHSGYFSHAQAQRDFGYHPVVSIEEGLERLRTASMGK